MRNMGTTRPELTGLPAEMHANGVYVINIVKSVRKLNFVGTCRWKRALTAPWPEFRNNNEAEFTFCSPLLPPARCDVPDEEECC